MTHVNCVKTAAYCLFTAGEVWFYYFANDYTPAFLFYFFLKKPSSELASSPSISAWFKRNILDGYLRDLAVHLKH